MTEITFMHWSSTSFGSCFTLVRTVFVISAWRIYCLVGLYLYIAEKSIAYNQIYRLATSMFSKIPNSQLQSIATPVNDELVRLASYLNWPSSAEVRPSALSRHGFTYEGEGDRTRCVACGIVVHNWQRGDQPLNVHRNRSPRCPFVITESISRSSSGQDAYDTASPAAESARSQLQQLRVSEPQASIRSYSEILPSTTLPSSTSSASEPSVSATGPSVRPPSIAVDRSRPDYVQLRSESVRLSTFHDWPSSSGRIVDPRDLAATGLFYTGQADRVQCAFCRGFLRSWRPGDRPAEEHRRHFPDCPLMRGAVTENVPSDSASYVDSQLSENQAQPAQLNAGKLLVKSTAGNSDSHGSGFMMTTKRDAISSQSTDTIPASSASLSAAAAAAATAAMGIGDSMEDMDEECLAELEEYKRLREARTCKVCMDSEVNTVFLPCGHLVCCDTCSPALRNCAVCRALIRGTVKVFLG